MKLGTFSIPTEEVGDLWTLSGVIYDNGKQAVSLILPFARDHITGLPITDAFPSDEEWHEFLKQTDDPVTPVGKAFVRKAARQVIESVRYRCYARDNYCCRYCGVAGDQSPLTLDHYVAQKFGGEWTFDNLLTSCRSCQKKKGHMTVAEWTEYATKHGLKVF